MHPFASRTRMVHVRNCCLPFSSISDCLQRYSTWAVYTFSQRGTRAVASRPVKAPPPLRKQHHGGDPVRLLRMSLELARPMYHSKQFAFVCMGHVLLCCHLHPSRVRMGHVRKCCLPFSSIPVFLQSYGTRAVCSHVVPCIPSLQGAIASLGGHSSCRQ